MISKGASSPEYLPADRLSIELPPGQLHAGSILACSPRPAPYTFSNDGAGLIYTPKLSVVNLNLTTRFTFLDGDQLELRAEAFNLFSITNFNGQTASSATPRSCASQAGHLRESCDPQGDSFSEDQQARRALHG